MPGTPRTLDAIVKLDMFAAEEPSRIGKIWETHHNDQPDAAGAWSKDIVLKLRAPTADEATSLGDRTLVSMLYPGENPALVEQLHAPSHAIARRVLSRGTLRCSRVFKKMCKLARGCKGGFRPEGGMGGDGRERVRV